MAAIVQITTIGRPLPGGLNQGNWSMTSFLRQAALVVAIMAAPATVVAANAQSHDHTDAAQTAPADPSAKPAPAPQGARTCPMMQGMMSGENGKSAPGTKPMGDKSAGGMMMMGGSGMKCPMAAPVPAPAAEGPQDHDHGATPKPN